jgi:hypothetical protein
MSLCNPVSKAVLLLPSFMKVQSLPPNGKKHCIKCLSEITLKCSFLIGKIWDLIAGNEPAGAETGRILTFEGREAIG